MATNQCCLSLTRLPSGQLLLPRVPCAYLCPGLLCLNRCLPACRWLKVEQLLDDAVYPADALGRCDIITAVLLPEVGKHEGFFSYKVMLTATCLGGHPCPWWASMSPMFSGAPAPRFLCYCHDMQLRVQLLSVHDSVARFPG